MNKFNHLFIRYTDKHLPGRDWRLLKAQGVAESNLDPDAVSPAGAAGIMQFMPNTWKDVEKELKWKSADIKDPDKSIEAGAYYMAKMLNGWTSPRPDIDRYCLALASYNAGFGNLLKAQRAAGNSSLYAEIISKLHTVTGNHSTETIYYVKRILQYYQQLVTG